MADPLYQRDNENQPSSISDFTTDKWIHFAMSCDNTAVIPSFKGNFQAGVQGSQRREFLRRWERSGPSATARIAGTPAAAASSGRGTSRAASDVIATIQVGRPLV
jgi:hypothetical protein